MTLAILRPSSLISNIRLEPAGKSLLFKFSDELQERMEVLLEPQLNNFLSVEPPSIS